MRKIALAACHSAVGLTLVFCVAKLSTYIAARIILQILGA
jgi:hypothetical protein